MAQSVQVRKVSWQHEAIADLMIVEPQLSLGEIAKRLGFSLVWVSIVKNSDSFKDYFTLRRRIHSEALTSGIKEKAAAIAELSLDAILSDMEVKMEMQAMSAAEARENLDLVSKRFGFDGTASQQKLSQQVVLNVGMVSAETLESAREKLRSIPGEAVVRSGEATKLVEDKI